MIAYTPAYCLPASPSPMEIVCTAYTERDERKLMAITIETVSRHSMVAPFTSLKNRVSEISLLQDNWNGDGAVVPSDLVQKNTFKFLDCVLKTGLAGLIKPEDIVPSPYGTIELDFESERGLVSVEIGKDKIGFFTEFNDGDDFLSEGIPTDFRTIPFYLQEAFCRLEEHVYAEAIGS